MNIYICTCMQTDPEPSQDVLIQSENFGIVLADYLGTDGSVESDNIGMDNYNTYMVSQKNAFYLQRS